MDNFKIFPMKFSLFTAEKISVYCMGKFTFVLRLNVRVKSFSVMSGRSQCFLGLTSTVGS